MAEEFALHLSSFLAVEGAPEGGAQPLDAALALVGAAHVALTQHGLGDLLKDVLVFSAALQVLLHVVACPDVQQHFGLLIAPDDFGAV